MPWNNLSNYFFASIFFGKAATTMSRLNKRAWTNSKLTEHTKVQIYTACVESTFFMEAKLGFYMPDTKKD